MIPRAPIGAFVAVIILITSTVGLNIPLGEWFPYTIIGAWLMCVALVGLAISVKRPANAIGTIMLAIALCLSIGLFAEGYGSFSFELDRDPLPFAEMAAWLSLWMTIPGFALLIFLFLFFPTGRPMSALWRRLAWIAAAGTVLLTILTMFKKGPVTNVPTVNNPLGLWSLSDSALLKQTGEWALATVAIASLVALVIRFKRSHGVERQQMKWFAAGAVSIPVAIVLGMLFDTIFPTREDYLVFLFNMAGLLAVPLSMGVAILRYRLYDIDVIINRTLVYVVLTAALLGSYLLIVVTLSRVLDPVTGDSDIAVAASTLAVAALFRPLKTRIQTFIDRRFYRSRYDALRAVKDFTARLRNEVDIDSVRGDVLTVVSTTLQPRHASLWVKEPT